MQLFGDDEVWRNSPHHCSLSRSCERNSAKSIGNIVFSTLLALEVRTFDSTDNTRFCEHIRSGDVPQNLPCDGRIKAAVLADPAPSVAFTKNTLAPIHIRYRSGDLS
jgi:hypothetical protein